MCVGIDCDLRTLPVSFAACVDTQDCPGRCCASAPAERHMIYFRGKGCGHSEGSYL